MKESFGMTMEYQYNDFSIPHIIFVDLDFTFLANLKFKTAKQEFTEFQPCDQLTALKPFEDNFEIQYLAFLCFTFIFAYENFWILNSISKSIIHFENG